MHGRAGADLHLVDPLALDVRAVGAALVFDDPAAPGPAHGGVPPGDPGVVEHHVALRITPHVVGPGRVERPGPAVQFEYEFRHSMPHYIVPRVTPCMGSLGMANIVRNYFRLGPPTGNRDGTGVRGARCGARQTPPEHGKNPWMGRDHRITGVPDGAGCGGERQRPPGMSCTSAPEAASWEETDEIPDRRRGPSRSRSVNVPNPSPRQGCWRTGAGAPGPAPGHDSITIDGAPGPEAAGVRARRHRAVPVRTPDTRTDAIARRLP